MFPFNVIFSVDFNLFAAFGDGVIDLVVHPKRFIIQFCAAFFPFTQPANGSALLSRVGIVQTVSDRKIFVV